MDFYVTKTRDGEPGIQKRSGMLLSEIASDIRQWVEAGLYERVEVRDTYGNLVANWPRITLPATERSASQ